MHPDRARLLSMFNQKFVRVLVNCSADGVDSHVECWGLMVIELSDFIPLWSSPESWQVVIGELGTLPNIDSCGLTDAEINTAVDADETDTPDEAWAALAAWRLTGERLCDGTSQKDL